MGRGFYNEQMTTPTPPDLPLAYHRSQHQSDTFNNGSWADRRNKISDIYWRGKEFEEGKKNFVALLHQTHPAASSTDAQSRLEWLLWTLPTPPGYLLERNRYFREEQEVQRANTLKDIYTVVLGYLQAGVDLTLSVQEPLIQKDLHKNSERAMPLGLVMATMGVPEVFDYLPPSMNEQYASELFELAGHMGHIQALTFYYQKACEQKPEEQKTYLKNLWYALAQSQELSSLEISDIPDPPAFWWEGAFHTSTQKTLVEKLLEDRPHLKWEYVQGIISRGVAEAPYATEEEVQGFKQTKALWRNTEGWASSLIGSTIIAAVSSQLKDVEVKIKDNLIYSQSQNDITDQNWIDLAFLSVLSEKPIAATKQQFSGLIDPISKAGLPKKWVEILGMVDHIASINQGLPSPIVLDLVNKSLNGLCKMGLTPKENGTDYRHNPEKQDYFLQLLEHFPFNGDDQVFALKQANALCGIFPKENFLRKYEFRDRMTEWKTLSLYSYVLQISEKGKPLSPVDIKEFIASGPSIADLGLSPKTIQWMATILASSPNSEMAIQSELEQLVLKDSVAVVSHTRKGPRL